MKNKYLETTLNDIKVMFIESKEGTRGATRAFLDLESRLSTLKGRKFFGVIIGVFPREKYRACVKITDEDNPKLMGPEVWTIPGGRYARVKIKDWQRNLKKIGAAFESMAKECEVDSQRPFVEFYRSLKEVILFLPIK